MYVTVIAGDLQLAAVVKEHLDLRRVGVTEIMPVSEAWAVERALQTLRPSAQLLVGRRLDSLLLDLCRRLARNTAVNGVPIVVALEQAVASERIKMLNAGVDAVVDPIDLYEIEWRLSLVCDRPLDHGVFGGNDIFVDATGSTVMVSGEAVALTAREASLLRALVQRRGGVVSRGELEHRIWGGTRSRTLDVHVARLRKKLGPIGYRVKTLSKVGYRYVEFDMESQEEQTEKRCPRWRAQNS